MTPLPAIRLADPDAERVRQATSRAIGEIQSLPFVSARVITATFPNGVELEVAHGLGREPLGVFIAPPPQPVGAIGGFTEFRVHSSGRAVDRKQVVCLQAVGWGATITVQILVL